MLENIAIKTSLQLIFGSVAIDIVKEEFVRPLIGFQDRFEKTSSGK